jgi:hypothetical protein
VPLGLLVHELVIVSETFVIVYNPISVIGEEQSTVGQGYIALLHLSSAVSAPDVGLKAHSHNIPPVSTSSSEAVLILVETSRVSFRTRHIIVVLPSCLFDLWQPFTHSPSIDLIPDLQQPLLQRCGTCTETRVPLSFDL